VVVQGENRRSSGEETWHAEILMPQGRGNFIPDRVRTMCIRGPHRVDKQQAFDDARKFDAAAAEGGRSSCLLVWP